MVNPTIHKLKFEQMNEAEISKLIDNLKPKTSAGHDGLSTKLLKLIK